jgi:CheY-like chemotaxis protein
VKTATGAGVSPQLLHDLRSPLNQIIGYSEILGEDAQAGQRPDAVIDLARIGDAGRKMLALIDEHFATDQDEGAERATHSERPAAEPATAVHAPVPGGRLLVVDDDAANRDVLSRRLQQQGHSVTTASSGREALDILSATAYDIVLLDIMMPDMDGYETIREVRAMPKFADLPIIAVTAKAMKGDRQKCIQAGASDYVSKPVDIDHLVSVLRVSIQRKDSLQLAADSVVPLLPASAS